MKTLYFCMQNGTGKTDKYIKNKVCVGAGGVDAVITYDGRKEFRSRAASGHERSTCYIFTKMETL